MGAFGSVQTIFDNFKEEFAQRFGKETRAPIFDYAPSTIFVFKLVAFGYSSNNCHMGWGAFMGPGNRVVSPVKAAAARYLCWGSLIAMVAVIIVARGCDDLLFHFYPGSDWVMARLFFVLTLIFFSWSICVIAFERRRLLLRLAIRSAQWRLGDRQGQPTPALGPPA